MLLSNNLLILELEKLPLFFKIGYDLCETFLKQIDLGLEQLDLLVLLKLLLGMLFNGLTLRLQLNQGLVVLNLKLCVLVVEVGQLLILDVGLFFQSNVLNLNIFLNLTNALLCVRLSRLPVLIKQVSILLIDPLLLSLDVFLALLVDLAKNIKKHSVTVLLIFNLLLLDHLCVVKFIEFILLLR